MAAPVIQSTQSAGTNPNSSGSVVVTKPVNLAVGDLMIAYAVVPNTDTASFPSGFTSLGSIGFLDSATLSAEVRYKFATAGDVAASDFTFTAGIASISRITGKTTAGGIVYVGSLAKNTASPSATGLTPKDYGDGTLLMQFWSVTSGSSPNIATFAIATSNPSWTQAFEITSGVASAAVASATRPEVTATGNMSATGGGAASADWTAQMISIPIDYEFAIADSVTVSDMDMFAQTTKQSETVTTTDDTDAVNTSRNFVNQAKSATSTVVNQEKS